MNVSDIMTRVKRQFGDEASTQITNEDIWRWITDGQREIATVNTGVLEKIATVDSVAGQNEYSLPADILRLRSVHYRDSTTSSYLRITSRSLAEFNEYVDGWSGPLYGNGIPEIFHVFASKLMLFPTPVAAVTAGIKVYYTRQPTDVTSDLVPIDVPLTYHNRLVEYVLQQAFELDGDWNASANKAAQFTTGLGLLNARDQAEMEYYPTITVLPDDQE